MTTVTVRDSKTNISIKFEKMKYLDARKKEIVADAVSKIGCNVKQ